MDDVVDRQDLLQLGRFSEPAIQVLVSLAADSKHGWAIANDVEQRTGRRPQPATLYGALTRLEERNWIAPLEADGRRRPYMITPDGIRVLRARLAELEALVTTARRALRARTA